MEKPADVGKEYVLSSAYQTDEELDRIGSTYRAVCTVRFAKAVFMLHAFQKKAKKGFKTPKHEIELIEKRLKMAEEHYAEWIREQEKAEEEPGS
jgi:phage-related protein